MLMLCLRCQYLVWLSICHQNASAQFALDSSQMYQLAAVHNVIWWFANFFFPVSLMWLLLLLLAMCAENISRPASQGLNGSTNIGFSWLYLSEFNSTVAHLYKCTNGNCFVRIQLSSDTPF